MLTHAYEFIRIADAKPEADKVSKRTESATELVTTIASKQNRGVLLGCVQGVISGFGTGFTDDSPAVVAVLKVIKDRDSAFPNDLSENAQELRACAALAVGELLVKQGPKSEALTAALAVRSGMATRPDAKEKHLKGALQKIAHAAEDLISSTASSRRQRSLIALRKLQNLEEPAAGTDLWKTIMPVLRATMRELYEHAAADREEIESLWWLFQDFSDIAQKPLSGMSPSAVAVCAGIELADRALVPPMASGTEMVRRSVEHTEKELTLTTLSLQDLTAEWDEKMMMALAPDGPVKELSALYPALLPLTYATCLRRAAGSGGKLPRNYSSATGFALTYSRRPSEWGVQVFHERILQRILVDASGS